MYPGNLQVQIKWERALIPGKHGRPWKCVVPVPFRKQATGSEVDEGSRCLCFIMYPDSASSPQPVFVKTVFPRLRHSGGCFKHIASGPNNTLHFLFLVHEFLLLLHCFSLSLLQEVLLMKMQPPHLKCSAGFICPWEPSPAAGLTGTMYEGWEAAENTDKTFVFLSAAHLLLCA